MKQIDGVTFYENPSFAESKESLIVYQDLYEGNAATLRKPKYLYEHELETTADGCRIRKIREARTHYTNLIEPLVSIWTSLFLSEDPEIDKQTEELFQDNIKNVDGESTSLISFIRDHVIRNYLIYGRPIIKVTAPTRPPMSKAEEEQSGFRPYFQILNPLTIPDWQRQSLEVQGQNKFLWLREEYIEHGMRLDPTDPPLPKLVSKTWRLAYDDQTKKQIVKITKYEKKKDANGKDSADKWQEITTDWLADWDEIPIVGWLKGESWIKDAVGQAIKYHNIESTLDNNILFQAHQRVILSGEVDDQKILALASYAINVVPEGTQVHTIPAADTSSIERRMTSVLNNFFRIGLNQMRQTATETNQVEAAETIAAQKQNLIDLIKSELERIETVINEAILLYAKYLGREDFGGKVTLSKEITEHDVTRTLSIFMQFWDNISQLPEYKKAALKWSVIQSGVADQEKIIKEIDAQTFEKPKLTTKNLIAEDDEDNAEILRSLDEGLSG